MIFFFLLLLLLLVFFFFFSSFSRYTDIVNYTEIVDHWAFGPHHVWSTPGTGDIRRMWQPFNGLQVFHGKFNRSVDESLFDDLPPKLCKKGGAVIRIKCNDDGLPNGGPNTTADVATATDAHSATPPSKNDIRRASQLKPNKPYRGTGIYIFLSSFFFLLLPSSSFFFPLFLLLFFSFSRHDICCVTLRVTTNVVLFTAVHR